MDNDLTRWIVLALLNTPLYALLGWIIFRTWDDFWECVRFWFTPDWFSMIRGELLEDWWGSAKIFVFLALCTGSVYGEHRLFFERHPRPEVSAPAPESAQP